MVYQISEKNQILIALFGIVVLCAGKLFKDYLNRGGYIEGFTFTTESDPKRLVRDATTDVTAKISLMITLEKELPSGGTIKVTWSGDQSENIVFSNTPGNYTATVENASTITMNKDTSNLSNKYITFSPTAKIDAKSWVKIGIEGITIKAKLANAADNVDKILNFTVTSSNGEAETSRDVKVLKTGTSAAAQGGFVTSAATMTVEEIEKAINSIDERLKPGATPAVSDAERISHLNSRAALISMLASTYGTVKEAGQVFDSDTLYAAQKTAIDFIQKEKSRSKKNAEMLKSDNSNKRRMAQVNTYYTRHYEANTDVMKNIIYVSIALIILAVLRNKELIPASISTLGIILVLAFGGIVIGTQVYDIIRRNDHDFDKYDWNFNEDKMNNSQIDQQNTDPTNLSEMGVGMAPCYGPGCCNVGTTWDNTSKKCSPTRISGTATWKPSSPTSAAGSLTLALKNSYVGALPTTGTIIVTLPNNMFTGSNITAAGANISGSATVTSITLIPIFPNNTPIPVGATITDIEIRGLSMNDSYNGAKTIIVRTSIDPNQSTIPITFP